MFEKFYLDSMRKNYEISIKDTDDIISLRNGLYKRILALDNYIINFATKTCANSEEIKSNQKVIKTLNKEKNYRLRQIRALDHQICLLNRKNKVSRSCKRFIKKK